MQLLEIILYHPDGRTRRVDFEPGALNIVTGESKAGKSALLTIVEYCLGRSSMLVPVGPIADTVAWDAALWQLPEGRAFVARPAPAPGRASSSQAMLEFGTDLHPFALAQLQTNIDVAALREQLGRRIGIEENLSDPGPGSLRQALEANIGHAALLCLQGQNEIASPTTLFHRQGEQGMDNTLRDTIPYFLGAVARDEARKRAQLRDARRTLTRITSELERADDAARTVEVELSALFAEARVAGLVDDVEAADRAGLMRLLQAARSAPTTTQAADARTQDRYRQLRDTRDQLRTQLNNLLRDRGLLLDEAQAASGATGALEQQEGRLNVLTRLPAATARPAPSATSGTAAGSLSGSTPTGTVDGAASAGASSDGPIETDSCSACGQVMAEPDPTALALQRGLETLRAQIENIDQARPARRGALTDLDAQLDSVRTQLRAAQNALTALERSTRTGEDTGADTRDFTRGRIDAILARAVVTDETALEVLRQQQRRTQVVIDALEVELDDDTNREQLTSRLFTIGRDMSIYAERLGLEHRSNNVRLDLARLTVVTDAPTGPAPLFRIGSAANAIGYHLAAHLALHRFLTLQNRPVPRLLMLDQPTQAHYPAEADNSTGQPADDADRVAVRIMFELMRDVVDELSPNFQLIVCDHADLPETWFQAAVRHRWRGGLRLIPADWLAKS